MAKSTKINYNHNHYHYYHQLPSNQSNYSYVTERLIPAKPLPVSFKEDFDDAFFAKSFNVKENSRIRVPTCSKRHIHRIPRSLLNKVDRNRERAVEICLFVLSLIVNSNPKYEWTNLSSEKLKTYTKYGKDNTFIYNHVLNVLMYSKEKIQSLIVVKKNIEGKGKGSYVVGEEPKKYKLSSFLSSKGTKEIELTHKDILKPYYSCKESEFNNLKENSIVKNILQLYPRITYPTINDKNVEAKRLINLGFKSKKGKALICKKNLKNIDEANNYMFVEECIDIFNRHKDRGALSISSSKNAGGRVTYNLNLINSWIRHLIKIDGEKIVELDFVAFHPNLAIKIYNGNQKYITHKHVAEELNLGLNQVKKQHLSYFNDTILGMSNRNVHEYYKSKEPEMVGNILNDKKNNGYKITSKRMFELEVQIMSKIIEILNSKGVYLIYIYDALACKKSDLELVKAVMEEVVLEFGVYTTVSVNNKFGYMENEVNAGIIYKVTNKLNGEVYVGSTTKTIEERKSDHLQRLDKDYSSKFHKALLEYGKDNFEWEEIDTAKSINELAEKEVSYISKYNSLQNGYNSDTGGGFKKLVYQFKDDEVINIFQSLEEASKAVNKSPNSISNACLGGRLTCAGYNWANTNTFSKREDKRLKPVLQYSLEGELLNEFKSIAIASEKTGVNKSNIAQCCRGEKNTAGGYIWKVQ